MRSVAQSLNHSGQGIPDNRESAGQHLRVWSQHAETQRQLEDEERATSDHGSLRHGGGAGAYRAHGGSRLVSRWELDGPKEVRNLLAARLGGLGIVGIVVLVLIVLAVFYFMRRA